MQFFSKDTPRVVAKMQHAACPFAETMIGLAQGGTSGSNYDRSEIILLKCVTADGAQPSEKEKHKKS